MPRKITKEAVRQNTDDLFTGMKPLKEQSAPAAEQPKRRPVTKKKEDAPTDTNKDKPKGKGLTVWMTEAEIDRLQLYSKITGDKKGEIISAALAEYMKKHPVTAAQKKAYQEEQTRLMSNV